MSVPPTVKDKGRESVSAVGQPRIEPMTEDAARERDHRRLATRAVSVSAGGLALTGAIELAIAILTGSVGLLGDAIHNLSDVSTSAVVFFGFWVSKKTPTDRYPYGLERAEDLAGLGVALVIWLSAALAGFESYHKLVTGAGTNYVTIGMAAAVIGILGNLAVSRYKLRIGTTIHSSALIADAHHSRLDALSSLGALIGLTLVALGFPLGDPIAGIAVTILILEVGFEVTRDVLHHLLDGIEPELIASVRSIAAAMPGVARVVRARGRWTGRSVRLELTLETEFGASTPEIENDLLVRIQREHEAVRELVVRTHPVPRGIS
jgi:cation diffusion facilitator family transporter